MPNPSRVSRRSDPDVLWDIGPPNPVEPVAPPPLPEGKDDDYMYALAKLAYWEAARDYERRHAEYLVKYADYKKYASGPVQVSVSNAKEALENDARAVAEGTQTHPRYYRYNPGFVK